jgi:hypothetical protein
MFNTRQNALFMFAKDAVAVAREAVVTRIQERVGQYSEDSGQLPWTAERLENKQAGACPFHQYCRFRVIVRDDNKGIEINWISLVLPQYRLPSGTLKGSESEVRQLVVFQNKRIEPVA